jgi:hypothetical protein
MPFYETTTYDSGARYDTAAPTTPLKKGGRMAGNPVPDLQDELLALCEDMADGCHNHEVALGLNNNKEVNVRADILALRNAESAYGTAKDVRQDAVDALQAADAAAEAWLGEARKVLGSFLGNRWSTAWEPTGWPGQSTAVPNSQEKRLNLCAALKIYFTNVPAHAVAALGVTAAAADAHFTAISNGRDLLGMKEQAQTTAKVARDAALRQLRLRARNLIAELNQFLADDDPRWHAFGLNMPSDPDTPEAVASLTLTANMAGKVVVTWLRARRATRYRIFTKIVNVDPEFVNVETVHDLEAMLEGLPSGQTLQVYIIAANDAGEAPASPTEEIVIP